MTTPRRPRPVLPRPASLPRSAAPRVAPIQDRVVETREQAPKVASTRILDATQPHAWLVGCEHVTCDHRVLVAKYDYRPVDFGDPDGDMIKTVYTAPGRRRCGLHIG